MITLQATCSLLEAINGVLANSLKLVNDILASCLVALRTGRIITHMRDALHAGGRGRVYYD